MEAQNQKNSRAVYFLISMTTNIGQQSTEKKKIQRKDNGMV